jgi:hypothetical protein
MSSKKLEDRKFLGFDKVWIRLLEATPIRKNKDLALSVGINESVVSTRKKENKFPAEWGFVVAQKYGLNTDWLLTGKGEIKIEKKDIVNEIQEWLDDVSATNKDFKIWFKVQFESKFPEFTEWKKRKEEPREDNKLSGISNVA